MIALMDESKKRPNKTQTTKFKADNSFLLVNDSRFLGNVSS